jgi:AcrR family transcriptional regulator
MPRKPDSRLEGRILDAAYHLWSKRGEKALTMRAVARGAGTTTPSVYQRFRNKQEMLERLRSRAQQNLFALIKKSRSLPEACALYLRFASERPHEYELLSANWAVRLAHDEPRPGMELVMGRLADRLGGSPAQHRRLALALTALAHGTATLLLQQGLHERISTELRQACIGAVEALIQGSSRPRIVRPRSSGSRRA